MKNKKGFTLIELLAVIVILAILLVIAVPKILNVIDSARANAWQESTALVKHAIEVNTQAPDPSTGTYKYTVLGLCSKPSDISEIAKVNDMTISCDTNTNIFTLTGTNKFDGRTATISCDSLGKCSVDEITNNGSSNSGGSSSVIEDETGYIYDGEGALTSGNGGDKDFVEELNPEWDVYLRSDGTKIEGCLVASKGTICESYGNYNCDHNSETGMCNNADANNYLLQKKSEAESKGATCYFDTNWVDGLRCDYDNASILIPTEGDWIFLTGGKSHYQGFSITGTCSTWYHTKCTND